jgi:hypothetical protein
MLDLSDYPAGAVLDAYIRWSKEEAAVRAAYRRWKHASAATEARAYAAYAAAVDREERACSLYAAALRFRHGPESRQDQSRRKWGLPKRLPSRRHP